MSDTNRGVVYKGPGKVERSPAIDLTAEASTTAITLIRDVRGRQIDCTLLHDWRRADWQGFNRERISKMP
jgi:hypothetical protein